MPGRATPISTAIAKAPNMLPEIGQIALILALLIAVAQSVLPLVGAHRGISPWMALARPSAYAQLVLVAIAYVILTHAFVTQDFSVQYVASNSNSLLPMIYRYTAVWGSHEGSLLLWVLVVALWTAAVARFSQRLPETSCTMRKSSPKNRWRWPSSSFLRTGAA